MTQHASSGMSFVVAADHGGVDLKDFLADLLRTWGYPVEDLGTHGPDAVDYPDFASQAARRVQGGQADRGLLVCGTGLGMSITANRFPGVRAALCTSAYMARMARAHNDANLLCLGGRVVGTGLAADILEAFVRQPFEGGRHVRRIGKIEAHSGREAS